MGTNLNDINPRLRDRILRQLRLDTETAQPRREAAARVPLQAAERPQPPPQLVGSKKGKRPRKAGCGRRYRVEFTVYSMKPMDWDNASGAIKEIQDHMVRDGWLPDGDGWRELEGCARGAKVDTKAEERTEAEIVRLK